MKTIHIISKMTIAACVLLLGACKVTQPYTPPVVQTDSLYRGVSTKDTTTIANLKWMEVFRDAKLQTLIAQGIANNNDLKVAVARIKQAQANLRQTKAAFLPTISGGPQVTQQKLANTQGGQFFNFDRIYEVSASASWEIDLWGKLRNSTRAALDQLLQSQAYRRAVQTQMVSDIATNYYNLLAYDKQLAITIETVNNRKEDVETNKALKEANRANEAAVAQSEANRYAAEVTIPDLQNSIRQSENALSILIGHAPQSIVRDSINTVQLDTSLATGVPAQLLANRPDVQEAEYSVRYYFDQINVARAYFYPSLTITAQGGWQGTTVSSLFNSGSVFGSVIGGLSQPIFNKGLNRQRLELAQAQYEENVATFQQKVLDAGREVSDALYSYESASNKTVTRAQQLDALKRAVDYNRELLKTGYATYTDVLTSEQGYLSAQLSSINDKLQSLTATVTLYRSLGGGWK